MPCIKIIGHENSIACSWQWYRMFLDFEMLFFTGCSQCCKTIQGWERRRNCSPSFRTWGKSADKLSVLQFYGSVHLLLVWMLSNVYNGFKWYCLFFIGIRTSRMGLQLQWNSFERQNLRQRLFVQWPNEWFWLKKRWLVIVTDVLFMIIGLHSLLCELLPCRRKLFWRDAGFLATGV